MPSVIEPLDIFICQKEDPMVRAGLQEGRMIEGAEGREVQTDGQRLPSPCLSLAVSQSSPAVYPVVRFSMSFKHKLQPVSTSALLGLSSSPVSSSNSSLPFSTPFPCLFNAVVPFPPLPPYLCLHLPPHPSLLQLHSWATSALNRLS